MIRSACFGHCSQRYSCGVRSFGSTSSALTGSLAMRPVQTPRPLAASVALISKRAVSVIGLPVFGSGTPTHFRSPLKNSDSSMSHAADPPGGTDIIFVGVLFQSQSVDRGHIADGRPLPSWTWKDSVAYPGSQCLLHTRIGSFERFVKTT